MSPSSPPPVLFLVRHARAGGPAPGERDVDRSLDPVGRQDAARLAARVAERGWSLGHVVCSPARRCRETADRLLAHGGHASFTLLDTLYDGGLDAYLAAIARSDATAPLTLIGHNPTLEHLVFQCLGTAAASRALPAGVQPGTLIALGTSLQRPANDVPDAADPRSADLPNRLVDVLAP